MKTARVVRMPACCVVGAFLLMLCAGCGEQAPPPGPAGELVALQFQVEGMHCTGCERAITTAVEGLDGMKVVQLSHSNGVLEVESDGRTDPSRVAGVITPLGYQVSTATGDTDGGGV